MQVPKGARGVGSSGAGATGGCEQTIQVLGAELCSFVRAGDTVDCWAISPAPPDFLLIHHKHYYYWSCKIKNIM